MQIFVLPNAEIPTKNFVVVVLNIFYMLPIITRFLKFLTIHVCIMLILEIIFVRLTR